MATLVLQLFDTLSMGMIYLFSVAMALVIFSWLAKVIISRGYSRFTPATNKPTVAVIIPVVDEDPKLFRQVCSKIIEQGPDRVIVVINGTRDLALEKVCESFELSPKTTFSFMWYDKPGKRYAIVRGLEQVQEQVTVLVDSDTLWQQETLANILAPFQDLKVGGVTGNQRIAQSDRNLIVRWADWFELLRTSYSLPAMSTKGQVGCLPGRTIAFRTVLLKKNMRKFLHDRFLGTHLEISDDRALTNYTLLEGYKTVYQDNSVVTTSAPATLGKFIKQQYRWAKGSQYNNLKMFGWMLRNSPFLLFVYVVDMLVPLILVSNAISWVLGATLIEVSNTGNFFRSLKILAANGLVGMGVLISSAVIASWAVHGVRTSRVTERSPTTFWFLPIFMLMNTLILVPIRVMGFLTCSWNSGWGTRDVGNQSERTRNKTGILGKIFPTILGICLMSLFTYWGIYL